MQSNRNPQAFVAPTRGAAAISTSTPGDADNAPPAEVDGELKGALRYLVQEGLSSPR